MSRFYKLSCIIFLVFWGCKEEDTRPSILEYYGIFDFKVEGVPNENIKNWQGHGVAVYLPADYKGGHKLKVSFRHSKKGIIDKSFNENGWINGSTIYEGNTLILKGMGVVVIPFRDTEILTAGEPYRLPLVGKEILLNCYARNWGTDFEPADSVWMARLIDKTTGKVTRTNMFSSIPAEQGDPTPISIKIPENMDVGEYKVLLYRRDKPVELPDLLILEYGKPEAGVDFWPPILVDTARIAGVWGYNLLPGHKYEMILSNDFFKPENSS